MKQRILVVEDDPSILTGLVDLLQGEGFAVVPATTGTAALARHAEGAPDLVLLDVMIPEKSGYDVCREIRRTDPVTPVIMLTAKGQEVDRVVGLELGADDYVVKPFGANELVARVRAVLRRGRPREGLQEAGPLSFGDVIVDPRTMRGSKGGRDFDVSRREIALLQFSSPGKGRRWTASRSWTRCGASATRARRGRWTSTSRVCGRRWRTIPPIPGTSRRSTAQDTGLQQRRDSVYLSDWVA